MLRAGFPGKAPIPDRWSAYSHRSVSDGFDCRRLLLISHRSRRGRRHLGEITESSLTKQLRELEADGFIDRHDFQEVPPHVEYTLTELGESFLSVIHFMKAWGEKNLKEMEMGWPRWTQMRNNAMQDVLRVSLCKFGGKGVWIICWKLSYVNWFPDFLCESVSFAELEINGIIWEGMQVLKENRLWTSLWIVWTSSAWKDFMSNYG